MSDEITIEHHGMIVRMRGHEVRVEDERGEVYATLFTYHRLSIATEGRENLNRVLDAAADLITQIREEEYPALFHTDASRSAESVDAAPQEKEAV